MTANTSVPTDHTLSFPDAVSLQSGVRCELVGPRCAPVIAVLGGISASKHVTSSASDQSAGWWEEVVGPGRAIDTRRFRVLSIDYVVGRSDEPVTTGDQAEALARALDEAGVRNI